MRSSFFRAIFALGIALPAFAQAQSVSVTGGAPATETFDTLASSGSGSALPTGWFLHETSGTAPANTQYTADDGATASGSTYSYGSTGSTERAFGLLLSGSNTPTIGARLQNNTGGVLTELQVEYDGEQWRLGNTGRTDRIDFQYSLDATSLTTGTWTSVDSLDFSSLVTTGTVGARDGNTVTASRSAIVSGLGLAVGGTMWVRWTDFDVSPGADDGLAVDNVVFSIPGDSPPALGPTVPAAGASAVARDETITLNFTEPVTTNGAWYDLVCATSGVHAAVVSGTGASRTIDPDVDFAFDEDCTLTLDPALILDQDAPADPLAGDTRLSFHTAVEPVDVAPTVASFNPANGAGNVAVSSPIVVKFSEAVTVGANWYTLACANSGAHAATVTPDSTSQYTVNPDVDFGYVESCTFTVNGAQVTDQDGTPHPVAGTPATTFTTSAAPGAYYAGVDASSCVALRTTLHATIDDHTAYPYTHGTLDDTWTVLERADQDPLDASRVLEVYENVAYAKAGGGNTSYNREHTWPNSYGFNNLSGTSPAGVPVSSAYTDTHMLYLSDIEYNSNRGSKPYATCSAGCTVNATQAYNGFGGGAQTYPGNHNWYATAGSEPQGSYEVWNHRRGDIARAVLYMDVRYEGGAATGGNTTGQSEPDLVVTDNRTLIGNSASTTGGTAYMGLKSALIAWHDADPPDAQELLRNDVVFSFQGNRNPFIDHPEWVAIAFTDPCTGTPPANLAPTLNDASAIVLENAPAATNVATLAGTDPNAGQALAYSIVSGNASGAFAINAGTGAVTVANAALIDRAVAASYALVVRATDNGTPPMSDDATLSISITQVNDAPSFTKGPDATANEDAGAQTVPGWASAISAGPSDESAQSLAFTVSANTNAPLFASGPAVSSNGTLSWTPAANASGTATITLRLTDDGGTANGGVDASATQSFVVTVDAVNDAPAFTRGADVTIAQDAGPQSIAGWATAIGAGPNEGSQTVSFEVTNNTNAALFSTAPAIASNGTLTYTPAAGQFGSATITLRARDDGGTANGGVDASATQSFTITVTQVVNQSAVANDDAPAAVLEDASATTFGVLGNDSDAESDPFVVTGITQPANGTATIGPAGASVTFTPAANFCGATSFTYTVTGGDTATVSVTVTCVNDPPSFTKGADISSFAGELTFPAWATGIGPGPANEAGQAVTFEIVSNSNPALFTVAPAVAPDGTLSFTVTGFGVATIALRAVDDGGGTNASATQSFVVTILDGARPDEMFRDGFE